MIVTTSVAGGGAEFVARTWAEWLAARGHVVRLVSTSTIPDGAGVPAVDLQSLDRGSVLRAARSLRAKLRLEPADVVVAVQSYPNLVALMALTGWRNRPALIVSERNITTRENEPPTRGERLKLLLAKRWYRRADLSIGVSHAVAAELVGAYGIPGGRAVVVPNPSGRSAEERDASVMSDRAGDGTEPLYIVLPMRLVPQKRATLAVDAAALLRRRGVDARLYCFGKGPTLTELEHAAAAAAVPLTVPGWTADWVAAAPPNAVAVLPSYREGFGNVLVEAALGGIPSVAVSNAYGVADALIPGITGQLAFVGTAVDLADAIERARGMSMPYATRWAARFSTDESGRLLTRALASAIGVRSRA